MTPAFNYNLNLEREEEEENFAGEDFLHQPDPERCYDVIALSFTPFLFKQISYEGISLG